MSQAAADALVAEGNELFREEHFADAVDAVRARGRTCFRSTRSAGRASATRCCAWASRTRPRARSIGRSAYAPTARPRCGAARSRTPRSATRSSRRTTCGARSRCSRRGSTMAHGVAELRRSSRCRRAPPSCCAAVRPVLDADVPPRDDAAAIEVGRIATARVRPVDVRDARAVERGVARARAAARRAGARRPSTPRRAGRSSRTSRSTWRDQLLPRARHDRARRGRSARRRRPLAAPAARLHLLAARVGPRAAARRGTAGDHARAGVPDQRDNIQAWKGLGPARFETMLRDRRVDILNLRRSGL